MVPIIRSRIFVVALIFRGPQSFVSKQVGFELEFPPTKTSFWSNSWSQGWCWVLASYSISWVLWTLFLPISELWEVVLEHGSARYGIFLLLCWVFTMTRVRKYRSKKDPKQVSHFTGGETESQSSKSSLVVTTSANLKGIWSGACCPS